METGCCPSSFHWHRSRGHGCLWGSDESCRIPPQRRQKGKKEKRTNDERGSLTSRLRILGFTRLKEEERGWRKRKHSQEKRENRQRQLAPTAERREKGLSLCIWQSGRLVLLRFKLPAKRHRVMWLDLKWLVSPNLWDHCPAYYYSQVQ